MPVFLSDFTEVYTTSPMRNMNTPEIGSGANPANSRPGDSRQNAEKYPAGPGDSGKGLGQ